jgi:hypothetical protein
VRAGATSRERSLVIASSDEPLTGAELRARPGARSAREPLTSSVRTGNCVTPIADGLMGCSFSDIVGCMSRSPGPPASRSPTWLTSATSKPDASRHRSVDAVRCVECTNGGTTRAISSTKGSPLDLGARLRSRRHDERPSERRRASPKPKARTRAPDRAGLASRIARCALELRSGTRGPGRGACSVTRRSEVESHRPTSLEPRRQGRERAHRRRRCAVTKMRRCDRHEVDGSYPLRPLHRPEQRELRGRGVGAHEETVRRGRIGRM